MRRTMTLLGVFAFGVVLSAAVTAGMGWAGSPPSFPDVPADHPFHDDIIDLAGDCIAGGYGDGTFRPGAPVSRGAMAAFLSRTRSQPAAGVTVGGAYPTLGSAAPSAWSDALVLSSVTVTVPELPGNCVVPVEVHASASMYTSSSQADSCHSLSFCNVEVLIRTNGSFLHGEQLARVTSDRWAAGFSPTYLGGQGDGTTVTYELVARGYNVKPGKVSADDERNLVVTTHPSFATATG